MLWKDKRTMHWEWMLAMTCNYCGVVAVAMAEIKRLREVT